MAQSKLVGVVAGIIIPALFFFSGAQDPSPPDDAAEAARVAGVYEASAETLEAMAAQLPREQYDIAALAAVLSGKTPQEVGIWVDGHVSLIPYRGVLKGAQGALEDQHANSLDRALLIEAVLKAQGVPVRLARATLADDQAEKMLSALEGRPAVTLVAAMPDELPLMEKFYSDPRVDGARRRARDDQALSQAASVLQTATAQFTAANARLQEQAAAVLAAAEAQETERRRSALADHWWVQAESGGVWVDIDPSAPLLGPLTAADTYAADRLPDDLRRAVTIRVVAEFSREGKIVQETLLAKDFDPSEVSGRVIQLRHQPLGVPSFKEIGERNADFDAGLSAAMRDSAAWVPVLVLGDDMFTDRLVATDGDVSEATEANVMQHGGDGSNAVADGIGGATGGLDQIDGEASEPYEENSGPVKFTAEFVEIETRAPGEAPRIERRALFDAIGPAARARRDGGAAISDEAKTARGFAMFDDVEIMITTGRLSPARAAARVYESAAVGFKASATWMRSDATGMPSLPDGYRPANMPLIAFATGRMTLGAGDASPMAQSDANAIMTRLGMRPGADGVIKDVLVFDIVLNRLRGSKSMSGIQAGVADTFAEHIAVGAPEGSRNAAVRYAKAVSEGAQWRLLLPGDSAGLAALAIDADSAAMVADDLSRGYAVIVPERIASLDDAVWWRIDPATGETLGMNALGGAEFVEFLHTVGFILVLTTCVKKHDAGVAASVAAGNGGKIDTSKKIGIATCLAGAIIAWVGGMAPTLVGELGLTVFASSKVANGLVGGGYLMAGIGGHVDP